ncbi:hypothetical protein ACMA1I_18085 [Pontibacter sp. 13R65]|uniref:hypothetical protein n=1 Tax=Pontibacter sp. 13R65 TaxID=3127458 RepID=UPI00301D0A4A
MAGLVFYLRKSSCSSELKPYFYPALFLKLLCGLLLGVLYFEYYQEGDTLQYYRRGLWATDIISKESPAAYLKYLILDVVPASNPLAPVQVSYYSSAWNMVKLVSIPLALTGGNYYLSSLYLTLFSFAGLWFLATKLSQQFPGTAKAAVLAFLLIPSIMFWSSGVMKESFIMGGMGYCIGWLVVHKSKGIAAKVFSVLFAIAGLCLIWYVKYFVAIALGLFMILAYILKYLMKPEEKEKRRFNFKALFAMLFSLGAVVLASQLNYNLNFDQMPVTIYENYLKYNQISANRPSIQLPALEPTYLSFAAHAPEALIGVLFRPFLWEVYNPITLVAAIENAFLLLLVFVFLKDVIQGKVHIKAHRHLLLAALLYILVMGVLLAFSMPNLGTLNRYRIVILPFLVFLLLQSPSSARLLSNSKLGRL